MNVRAWLVDLDGTLYHGRPVRVAMAAELLVSGWGSVATLKAFRAEHERLRRELEAPVRDPFRLQLERTAERIGLPPEVVEKRVSDWMFRRPRKWVRRFRRRRLLREIIAFRDRGGRVAVVSDYPTAEKLSALGAGALFDAVVANGEPDGPGRLKPWPDGYVMAAERLGVSAAECLIIGDRTDADGEAARRAGMRFRRV